MNKRIDFDKDNQEDYSQNDYGSYNLTDSEIVKIVDPADKAWDEIVNA